MTQIAINQQIDAIRQVTAEVLKSKESALKFLKDAGIIRDIPAPTVKEKVERKTK